MKIGYSVLTMKVAIIPAAGKPTNRMLPSTNLPDAMLPINGKPVIGYIIEDLISRGIEKIIIVLNPDDFKTDSYVLRKFGTRTNIIILRNNKVERGIGYSIFLALNQISDSEKPFINLGDTIYKGELTFKDSFIVVSGDFEESSKWSFVEIKESQLIFINKPINYKGDGKIICGIFFFNNSKLLKEALKQTVGSNKPIEITDVLSSYSSKEKFKLVPANKWYDCGNIENFYKVKIDFLRTREFNSITYNDLVGIITKKSKNKKKLFYEINWYLNLPPELKPFAPRLFDYKINGDSWSYSLEFYGYPSLADLFLYNELDFKFWSVIINRLFEIIKIFRRYRTKLSNSFFYDVYLNKLNNRLSEMQSLPIWEEILSYDNLIINDKRCSNIFQNYENIKSFIPRLIRKSDATAIHGDLCLSNILFDIGSRIFKFVDPRGGFSEPSIFGDIKYDLAKLRHSFCSYYDFIVSDLFSIDHKGNEFAIKIFLEETHSDISRLFDSLLQKEGYNLIEIKFIESLLFITMIPLHKDKIERQKAMFATGILLLNQVFNKKKI